MPENLISMAISWGPGERRLNEKGSSGVLADFAAYPSVGFIYVHPQNVISQWYDARMVM
jgi:hypothetical protein